MPLDERALATVRGWVEKAENDLKIAALALRAGDDCPADAVAFDAQQCAEKYLKALPAYEGIDFPKTHDPGMPVTLLRGKVEIGLTPEQQRRLTLYATVTRYPGDYEPVTLSEAKRAVALARKVRREVRLMQPKEALGRRKA
jgi:HEPN domain-containing protein